jgi:hypothetical protein
MVSWTGTWGNLCKSNALTTILQLESRSNYSPRLMSNYATSMNISTEQNDYNPNHAVRVEHNIQGNVEPRQTQTRKRKGALVTYSQQRLGLDCVHRDPLLPCDAIHHLKPHLVTKRAVTQGNGGWELRNENPSPQIWGEWEYKRTNGSRLC